MPRPIVALLFSLSLATLAAVALVPAIVTAGGGCHGEMAPPGDGESSVIKIDGCMFFPTVARVPVGTTVRFLNTGDTPHNITGVVGSWASPLLEPGDEFRQPFQAPGVYPFACTLHPGMNGAIVVGEGQAAVADLATASQPTQAVAEPGSDSTTFATVAVALVGVGVGLGLGILVARLRPRTTD